MDVYDIATGCTVTQGLQGSAICDQGWAIARDSARLSREGVVVEEDDGEVWILGRRGGKRRATLANLTKINWQDCYRYDSRKRALVKRDEEGDGA